MTRPTNPDGPSPAVAQPDRAHQPALSSDRQPSAEQRPGSCVPSKGGAAAPFTPAEIRLHLPLCPPVNNLFFNLPGRRTAAGKWAPGGRARSQRYRTWAQAAGWDVEQAAAPRLAGAVTVEIAVPARMPGDLDGRSKAAIDLLVTHGLIEDDRLVHELLMRRDPAVPKGRMLVLAREHRPALYQRAA